MLLKIVALGVGGYLSDAFNRFDGAVVLLSLLDVASSVIHVGIDSQVRTTERVHPIRRAVSARHRSARSLCMPPHLTLCPARLIARRQVLRAFRLLRVFKLLRSWTSLQRLLSALLSLASDFLYLMLLLALILFIFALLGMQASPSACLLGRLCRL